MLQIIAQHPFSFNFVMCLLSYLAAGIFFNAAFMEPGEATYLLIAGIVAACAQGYASTAERPFTLTFAETIVLI